LPGLPPLPEVQGQGFRKLLTGHKEDLKEYAHAVFLEDNMTMITGKEWIYIFMTGKRDLGLEYARGFGAPGISQFLYDLMHDTGETTNLAYDINYAVQVLMLRNKLLTWFKHTHPNAFEVSSTFTTEDKLMWFSEPRDVGAEYSGKPLRVIPKQ